MEKYFNNVEYVGLTHAEAMKLCIDNPQFVMSRADWIGYHYIINNKYLILIKPSIYTDTSDLPMNTVIECGSIDNYEELKNKIYNVDDDDWLVGYRTDVAKELEINAPLLDYYLYHKLVDDGIIIEIEEEETNHDDEV